MMLTATIIFLPFIVHMIITRLYTEEYFLSHMSVEGIPEIQRSNLVSCVIQVWYYYGIIQFIYFFKTVFFSYGGSAITGCICFSSIFMINANDDY